MIVKIRDIYRNLQQRRRCLTCLPFGMPRGRWHGVKTKPVDERMKRKREYAKNLYLKRRAKLGSCPVSAMRAHRRKFILKIVGGKCQFCSYNRCARNLAFHHVESGSKDFNIGVAQCQVALPKLLAELQKCVLTCSNCHGEIHSGLVSKKAILHRLAEVRRASKQLRGKSWREVGQAYM